MNDFEQFYHESAPSINKLEAPLTEDPFKVRKKTSQILRRSYRINYVTTPSKQKELLQTNIDRCIKITEKSHPQAHFRFLEIYKIFIKTLKQIGEFPHISEDKKVFNALISQNPKIQYKSKEIKSTIHARNQVSHVDTDELELTPTMFQEMIDVLMYILQKILSQDIQIHNTYDRKR